MSEKKVSLKDLRELLEQRPRKTIDEHWMSGAYHTFGKCPSVNDYESWLRQFVALFNRFEKQLKEKLHRLKSLRAGSIYTEEQEQGMMIILKEVLGENEVERK